MFDKKRLERPRAQTIKAVKKKLRKNRAPLKGLAKPIKDSKNSIGGFSLTSTENSHRWFYWLLPDY